MPVAVALLVTACQAAPALPTGTMASAAAVRPGSVTAAPLTARPVPPSGSPSSTGFGEGVAVPCGGRPGGAEVISILRARGLVAAGSAPTVRTGPLCAGSWQYAVVVQPDREPLQVVTRGVPGALTLVTAGTDVCSVEVRVNAPAGIVAAARCG